MLGNGFSEKDLYIISEFCCQTSSRVTVHFPYLFAVTSGEYQGIINSAFLFEFGIEDALSNDFPGYVGDMEILSSNRDW